MLTESIAVKLNGGLGTSMGCQCQGAKSFLTVEDYLSPLDIKTKTPKWHL